ncbi:LTA synthase family protein [Streptococcus halotolerans]|uniref:LTA synthase family protein n=1 Tax=Streptococcus halotolerans TaxID=1814128 RepID=UPI0007894D8D|nr:alkaline phosphatase family protein [Streptococcus halotolerans]
MFLTSNNSLKKTLYIVISFLLSYLLSAIILYDQFVSLHTDRFNFVSSHWPLLLSVCLGILYSVRINAKFLIKVVILYLFFIVSAYFIEMTLQLNNPDFHWKTSDDFLQSNGLIYLSIILIIAVAAKIIFQKFSFTKRFFVSKYKDTYVLAQLLTSFYTTSNQMLSRVQENTLLPTNSESFFQIRNNIFTYILGFYILFFGVSLLLLKSTRDLKKKKVSIILAVTTSIALAVIFNYTIQSAIKETGSHYNLFITPGATIFQIIIFSVIFGLLYIIINRYMIATMFIIIMGSTISVANTLKYRARLEPLLPYDLAWLKDITFFKDYISSSTLILAFILLVIIITIIWMTQKYFFTEKIIKTFRIQVMLTSVLLVCFISPIYYLKNLDNQPFPKKIPIASSVFNVFDINWLGINANARFQSLSYVWLKNLTVQKMPKPEKYTQASIENIYLKYNIYAKELNKERPNKIDDQTTIFVLSESLSDPTRLKGIQATQSPILYINSVMQGHTGGQMISDGYGGGTANMEFQSLTGLPFTNFDNNVSVAYSEIVPRMKKIPSVSDFYDPKNRTVIHLNGAQNYNRATVYKKLQFNKFVALSGGDTQTLTNENYGPYPSDQATYANILNELSHNQSQFIYGLTMQNHGPYHKPQKDFDISGDNFSEVENAALKDYSDRLSETDQATRDFLQKLQFQKKDITVVFYGDHLPGLYPTNFFDKQPDNKQKTDYFIWSNHNKNNNILNYSEVRSNDFPALLFKVTKSKVSPYYALLTKALPNKENKVNKISQEDLKLIQYDLTVGNNYLKNYPDFFEILE